MKFIFCFSPVKKKKDTHTHFFVSTKNEIWFFIKQAHHFWRFFFFFKQWLFTSWRNFFFKQQNSYIFFNKEKINQNWIIIFEKRNEYNQSRYMLNYVLVLFCNDDVSFDSWSCCLLVWCNWPLMVETGDSSCWAVGFSPVR